MTKAEARNAISCAMFTCCACTYWDTWTGKALLKKSLERKISLDLSWKSLATRFPGMSVSANQELVIEKVLLVNTLARVSVAFLVRLDDIWHAVQALQRYWWMQARSSCICGAQKLDVFAVTDLIELAYFTRDGRSRMMLIDNVVWPESTLQALMRQRSCRTWPLFSGHLIRARPPMCPLSRGQARFLWLANWRNTKRLDRVLH